MTPERLERALAEVTLEARTEVLPDVDFAAIEERLPMTRVRTLPPRPHSLRPWVFAAAAAAAAALVGVSVTRGGHAPAVAVHATTKTAPAPTAAQANRELDGDALAPGAHVVAGELPQTVVHAGHARWTLAPHSEGTLLARGEVVTVRLDRGSVTSRVTKSSRTETFAIEAADVRVAAHGTEFVVSLGADGVSVSVTEGSVLVGPRSEPGSGQLLISPSARRYTLLGLPLEDDTGLDALGGSKRPTRPLPTAAGASATPASTPAGASGTPSALDAGVTGRKQAQRKPASGPAVATAEPAEQTPEQPTAEGLELTTLSVVRLTQACFKERTVAGEGVRVTAQTSITFRTLPEGGVNKVVFEPPLSPAVQACVNAGMSSIQSEPTRHGFQVSRGVDLER